MLLNCKQQWVFYSKNKKSRKKENKDILLGFFDAVDTPNVSVTPWQLFWINAGSSPSSTSEALLVYAVLSSNKTN